MDIVYSGEKVHGVKDRRQTKVINPVFFLEPDRDAKKVYLNGDFPRIKKAYERLNIPVLPLSEMPGQKKIEGGNVSVETEVKSK